MPQEPGFPLHEAPSLESPAELDANTDNFFASLVEPHFGHGVPSHFRERTSNSLSVPHFSQ
jgi:hypothetical protein